MIRRINKKGQVDYGLPREIDLIDYISLFDEIKKCKWKSELVDTFARYGIKDDTKRTVETKGTCKSGKSGDLYATFVTVADNKNTKRICIFGWSN